MILLVWVLWHSASSKEGQMEKPILGCLAVLAAVALLSAGPGQDLGSFKVFPDNNVWKWDVSDSQVHPNSVNYVASVGASTNLHPDFGTVWDGAPIGIPNLVVDSTQPLVPIVYTDYGDESDPGPFPIPLTAQIEGGSASTGDRHVITIDTSRKILCELYNATPLSDHWEAESGAKFDLTINATARSDGHRPTPRACRFSRGWCGMRKSTAKKSRPRDPHDGPEFPEGLYLSGAPLREFEHRPQPPPMGLRFRMKASYDISGFSAPVRVICKP